MFLDCGNVSVAVGISLLSCVRAEIYVIVNALPVDECHSLIYHLPRRPKVFNPAVLEDLSIGVAVRNLLLPCTQAQLYVILYLLPAMAVI